MVITIDGPCASGKTSIAKALAEKYKFMYLDTGAIYRAIAVAVLENGFEPDIQALETVYDEHLARSITGYISNRIVLAQESNGKHINQVMFMLGVNINNKLRTAETTSMSSRIAVFPPVRELADDIAKKAAKTCPNIIAEGRDTGSVVFPDADKKFYLTADRTERVNRRMLQNPTEFPDFKQALVAMQIRDDRDTNRQAAPLTCTPDMTRIDSTDMTFDNVIDFISAEIDRLRA